MTNPDLQQQLTRPSFIKRFVGGIVGFPRKIILFFLALPKTVPGLPKKLARFFRVWVWSILTFTGLLLFYLFHKTLKKIFSFRLIPKAFSRIIMAPLDRFYLYLTNSSRYEESTINRVNLIELALRNMVFKKSRAMITVGGMAIGIGSIVFLVSIGFGLQNLVITRVARLDELKQTDISTQPGSQEKINDETLAKFKDFPEIDKSLPLIASVARVNLNNSVTDVPVYGVTTDYLTSSAIKPTRGKIFDSNELVAQALPEKKVAGATIDTFDEENEFDSEEGTVEFQIDEEEWVRVRSGPSRKSTLIGYTRRTEGLKIGTEVWGEHYPEAVKTTEDGNNQKLAPWIKATFPLWEQKTCEPESFGCAGGNFVLKMDTSSQHEYAEGYIAQVNMQVKRDTIIPVGDVLGITSDNLEDDFGVVLAESTSSADEAWIEIASESAATTKENVVSIELPDSAKKEAVVNTAMLKILGLNQDNAVGSQISTSFIIVSDLLNQDEKIESVPADYTIVGVIPDDNSPYFYVPFIDLRGLGVTNYSQVKVVATDKDVLAKARQKIESLGFSTRSVADTVKQIDRLFATARTVLLILGMVALSVAALGMFNTLTVSLLERTREVGLMKAMGMKSHEVQELFLTESMVMGFFGGILGILLGYLAGKGVGVILSIYSLSKGQGFLDVSYLPFPFVVFIFLLSLVVGIFTGIYPARRATRISALNALRYE